MSGMTDYLADALLKWVTGQTAMPSLPSNVYLALFTTAPTDGNTGGVEVSGTGYARVGINTSFAAPTGSAPSTDTSNAAISFASAGSNWGTVVAWGLFDAATAGNLLVWDWLGNDPWWPCVITSASPGVVTAYGFTAACSPTLANGASVVFDAEYGGSLPTGLSAQTPETVAGLSSDTFNVGVNTSSTGSCMVRQIVSQAIPQGVTATFASGSLVLAGA